MLLTPLKINAQKSTEAIQLLALTSDLLATSKDFAGTLNGVARILTSGLATWCTIDLVRENGIVQRMAAAHSDPRKTRLLHEILEKYPPKPEARRGVYKVIRNGQPIILPEITIEMWRERAENDEHLRVICELGSTSYMCVPLNLNGRTVGAIMLLSAVRTYDEQDLLTAERIANKIVLALDNAATFGKMRDLAHEVNNPLTVVKLYLEQLEQVLDAYNIKDAAVLEYVKKANQSVDRITKVINQISAIDAKPI